MRGKQDGLEMAKEDGDPRGEKEGEDNREGTSSVTSKAGCGRRPNILRSAS